MLLELFEHFWEMLGGYFKIAMVDQRDAVLQGRIGSKRVGVGHFCEALSCRFMFLLGGLDPSEVIHHPRTLGCCSLLEKILVFLCCFILPNKALKGSAGQFEIATFVGKAALFLEGKR